jgi:hypothetical protein
MTATVREKALPPIYDPIDLFDLSCWAVRSLPLQFCLLSLITMYAKGGIGLPSGNSHKRNKSSGAYVGRLCGGRAIYSARSIRSRPTRRGGLLMIPISDLDRRSVPRAEVGIWYELPTDYGSGVMGELFHVIWTRREYLPSSPGKRGGRSKRASCDMLPPPLRSTKDMSLYCAIVGDWPADPRNSRVLLALYRHNVIWQFGIKYAVTPPM